MADFEVPPLEHTPWPTPSRAIYGFVLYVSSYVVYGFYLIWAFLPDSLLHEVGLSYLPARHWVITFPFLVVFFTLSYMVGVLVRNVMHIPHFEDLDTLTDEYRKELADDAEDLETPVGGIPPVADLPAKELSKLHLE